MKVCTFKKKKNYMEMWTIFERKQSLERVRGVRKRKKTRGEKENGVGAWCSFLLSSLLQLKLHAKP